MKFSRSTLGSIIMILVIGISIVILPKEKEMPSLYNNTNTYHVENIIDGDTLVASYNGEETTVRLLGANTPESSGPYRNEECFGAEASEYLQSLLPTGSRIVIETDPTQDTYDQYGRLIAYVIRDDGMNIGEQMIAQGYAYEYTYRNRSYRYQDIFRKAEHRAREGELGLWGFCDND